MPYIIAIDGRAASGKTSLAEQLAASFDAPIVHLDDFFLPLEMRTEKRLNEPGGNVHYERFKAEVIDKLKAGEDFSYQRFDCKTKALADFVQVKKSPVVIVEGSYSHHPYFGDYADLKIFKTVDPDEQWRRILVRNGEAWGQPFKDKWIPLEEKYFEYFKIKESADIVL